MGGEVEFAFVVAGVAQAAFHDGFVIDDEDGIVFLQGGGEVGEEDFLFAALHVKGQGIVCRIRFAGEHPHVLQAQEITGGEFLDDGGSVFVVDAQDVVIRVVVTSKRLYSLQ